jgi:hypothetical protein
MPSPHYTPQPFDRGFRSWKWHRLYRFSHRSKHSPESRYPMIVPKSRAMPSSLHSSFISFGFISLLTLVIYFATAPSSFFVGRSQLPPFRIFGDLEPARCLESARCSPRVVPQLSSTRELRKHPWMAGKSSWAIQKTRHCYRHVFLRSGYCLQLVPLANQFSKLEQWSMSSGVLPAANLQSYTSNDCFSGPQLLNDMKAKALWSSSVHAS